MMQHYLSHSEVKVNILVARKEESTESKLTFSFEPSTKEDMVKFSRALGEEKISYSWNISHNYVSLWKIFWSDNFLMQVDISLSH